MADTNNQTGVYVYQNFNYFIKLSWKKYSLAITNADIAKIQPINCFPINCRIDANFHITT